MSNNSGVYEIINLINNNRYIGSSNNLTRRIKYHLSTLRHNKHFNKHLQLAWNKYGENNFKINIIEYCYEDILIKREQFYIDKYSQQELYNIRPVAESNKGIKWSNETKRKISLSHKGTHASEETKNKLRLLSIGKNNGFYGKHHTDTTKHKLSELHKEIKPTEKQLEALALGRKSSITKEGLETLRLTHIGENSATSKLTEKDVLEILQYIKNRSYSYIKLSEMYDISIAQISRIKSGLRWNYLKEVHPELYE